MGGGTQTSGHTQPDVVVVGAGHNGLTAAAYLARAGLAVLVLERRGIVGGACVTEEISPGCRASTASYIASMLRPEVVRDLDLPRHGLRMVPCEPGLQVPFSDGSILPWWSDAGRTAGEIRAFSARDAVKFVEIDRKLKRLARLLQPFFLEAPPDMDARGPARVREVTRLYRRLHRARGDEIGDLVSFLTGSLGDFLDRHFESDKVKTLLLANNVYGKHGGPYRPGSSMGLLFHLLTGGENDQQGYAGHVIGGMGSITTAMASAAREFGAEILTDCKVARIDVTNGRTRGVTLADGRVVETPLVLSGADPKRTFLDLVDADALDDGFRTNVAGIKMDGPCAKVNLVLAEEPRVTAMPADAGAGRRSLFTLVASLDAAEHCYEVARAGKIPEDLWVDCVVASNVDPTLAPEGRHIMTCFVQYVPYRLCRGTWDERRDELATLVMKKLAEYAPNVPGAVIDQQILTPLDLERTYGLTEGNIFHGDLSLDQLFFMRPTPGWSRYRTPVEGLYLCGAGAHPGGGVTGAPGYCAAHQVLRDVKRRRRSRR